MDPNDLISSLLGAPGLIGQQSQQNMNGLAQREALQQDTTQRAQVFQQQQEQQKSYDTDVTAWTAKGAPATGLLNLIARHPDKYQALKAGWDIKDDAQKTADLGYFGSVHAALDNNKPDLATKLIEDRITAEKTAGLDTAGDEQLLEGIKAGDLDALNSVKGFALANIAAATGPGKFAETYAKLGGSGATVEGKVVGNAIGHYEGNRFVVDYKSDKPEYRTVDVFDASGNKVGERVITLGEGGGQASGGAGVSGGSGSPPAGRYTGGWTPRARNGGDNTDAAVDSKIAGMASHLGVDPDAPLTGMSPMQIAQALTLSEGGPGSLADKNNNPGNLRDPKTLGYRKFPTKEAGLKAAAAQVARNLSRGQNTIRSMVEGRPVGGDATPASGAGVVYESVGSAKPGYRIMSPQENQAQGLDPNVKYQAGPNGQITALGGQEKSQGQLKPLPPQAQKSILENHSTLREIDNAIAAVQSRPGSFGFGTGALGDTFTQYNDPDGVSPRAAVGKVGGKIIHDVSGAAVTLSEAPRFQPYVPKVSDRPETILAKLRQLRKLAAGDQEDLTAAYGPDNGYRGVKLPGQQGANTPVKVRTLGEAMKLPKGTMFITPDGRRKVR